MKRACGQTMRTFTNPIINCGCDYYFPSLVQFANFYAPPNKGRMESLWAGRATEPGNNNETHNNRTHPILLYSTPTLLQGMLFVSGLGSHDANAS